LNDPYLGLPILIKAARRQNSLWIKSSVATHEERRKQAIAASYDDDSDVTLVHEVKRVGFLIDRYVDL